MTNRGLTLTAIVTLALLTALAVLVAGASAVSAQGTVPDVPDRPTGTAIFVGGVDLEWNDVPGADSYDVQMYRKGGWTDLPGDSIDVAFYGAGAIVSELDPDGASYWFRVRARNTHGFSEWSDFNFMAPTSEFQSGQRARPDNIPADGAPVIEGTAQVGESLAADTSGIEDGNGLDRVQFRFQWVSHDGSADTDIANATDSIYTVAATDVGNTIKVRVAFTDRGGYAESLTGGETTTVAAGSNSPATGQPTIAGTAQVGEALTAGTSSIADADGLTNASYSYQWIANDGTADTDIAGATDFTYTLADADEGAAVKVQVSFTDDAGNEEKLTSAATDTVEARPNTPATGAPRISSTAQVGETLTADISGIADADGLVNASFSYEWVAISDYITGGTHFTTVTVVATDSTYTVVAADEGKTIKVWVSFTDDAGNEEILTSAATDTVTFAVQQQVTNTPATGAPTISGTAQVGETLTADASGIVDADGLTNVSYSYQWLADDADITGATAATYTLVDADEDTSIKVRVSFTDDTGNDESLTSEATSLVAQYQPGLDLSSLRVSDQNGTTVSIGTFNPATTTYSGSVDSTVERINVHAIASAGSSANAQIIPRDSQPGLSGHQVELSHGTNLILVSVGSDSIDGVLKTYAVKIIRGGAAASGTANVVSINGGEYRAREGSTVPFLLTRTGDTTQALTVQIEISESYNDKVPASSEGRFAVEFEAGHASARHDVKTIDDSLYGGGTSSVEGRVRSGSGYTVGTNSGTLVWQVWDDDYGKMNLESIVVNDMASNHVDIGTFDPAEKSYSASVASTVEYVTVSAPRPLQGWWRTFIVPGDSRTDVPGHQVALSHGTNLIVVGVSDQTGLINTYELKIERQGTPTAGSPINIGVSVPDTGWEGAMLPFLLTRTGDTGQSLTVQIDVTETGGDMISSLYKGQKEVEFLAGEAFAKYYIGTMVDEVWEEHSTVRVEVKGGAGYQVSQSDGTATTLVKNDDNPAMTAVLTLDSTQVEEGDEIAATITVTTDGPKRPPVFGGMLQIKPIGGSATYDDFELVVDYAHPHLLGLSVFDFAPVWTDGRISAYQAQTTAFVSIIDDDRPEPDETFTVMMEAYDLRTDSLTLDEEQTSYTITITGEDETPPVPSEASYAAVVVTDSGTTGSTFAISWHDPAGCDSDYSARLKGGFPERWIIVFAVGPNGREANVDHIYQDIGSTSPENTEIVGTLEYISTSVYVERLDLYVHTDGLSVLVDCVGSHVVAEVPLPSQEAGSVERPKAGTYSSEAALTALTISSGILSPAFNKDGFLYAVLDMPNEDERVTFTAAAKSGYSISWYPVTDADPDTDGHQVDLEVGYNTIYATAESEEGLHRSVYEVIVKRAEETLVSGQQQADATLRALNLSGINLSFDPATTRYTVEVENGVTETTVTPTANDPSSTFVIKLDGVKDSDGTVSLLAQSNVITVEVTAADGVTNQTYTVTITRPTSILTGWPTISGTAQVGETLTADISAIADADGLANAVFTYQWIISLGNAWAEIPGATDSVYIPAPSDVGVAIKVRVSFTDDAGNAESLTSAATDAVEAVEPAEPPAPPTGLTATASHDQVVLSWDDPQDDSITGYVILRRNRATTAPGEFTELVADTGSAATTYTDHSVAAETLYTYRIKAINDHGLSDLSRWVRADTPAPPIPAKPTGLTAAASHNQVVLSWDDPQDDSITGYVILRRNRATTAPGEFTELVADTGSAANTYTDGSVSADTSYTYKIRAINEHGVSELSRWARADTPAPSPANSPATGAPTISGMAQVGETLTADTSGIADQDGLNSVAYSYQWLADDADIAGATATTYTVVDADEGAAIKVKVSFTDDAGNEEELTSAATEPVGFAVQQQIVNTPATGQPTISGMAQVGETLTADTSGISDVDGLSSVSYSYQWLADDAAITGATATAYTLADADEGMAIKLRVSFTDDAGNQETLTSVATDTVEARPNSPATGAPTISGTVRMGETLTADTSGIADGDGLTNVAYSYQWLADDADIAGATATAYTLADADEGMAIKLRVSFTDDAGNEETLTSAATDAVAAANIPATGAPTISGTARVGEVLTIDTSGISDEDGMENASFTFTWGASGYFRATGAVTEYTIQPDDEGKTVDVTAFFIDDKGNWEFVDSAPTSVVEARPNSPATGAPTISGTVRMGETLTADTSGISDVDGLSSVSYSYQWLADDAAITGATAATYTLTDSEQGKTVKVRVSFTDDAGNDESLTSAATGTVEARPNSPATGAPVIVGTAQVGETLTADTSGIADADGLSSAVYHYQWIVSDGGADLVVPGAKASTYTVLAIDRMLVIMVRVHVTDDRGHVETLTSAPTAVVR